MTTEQAHQYHNAIREINNQKSTNHKEQLKQLYNSEDPDKHLQGRILNQERLKRIWTQSERIMKNQLTSGNYFCPYVDLADENPVLVQNCEACRELDVFACGTLRYFDVEVTECMFEKATSFASHCPLAKGVNENKDLNTLEVIGYTHRVEILEHKAVLTIDSPSSIYSMRESNTVKLELSEKLQAWIQRFDRDRIGRPVTVRFDLRKMEAYLLEEVEPEEIETKFRVSLKYETLVDHEVYARSKAEALGKAREESMLEVIRHGGYEDQDEIADGFTYIQDEEEVYEIPTD